MITYKAKEDIPSFHLLKDDVLTPSKKNPNLFEHKNGLSLPMPLVENMVNNNLFERIEDVPKPSSNKPRIPTQHQAQDISLEDELEQMVTEFIETKDQGSNLIVNGPIGDYLKPFIDIKDAKQGIKENGLYHIGSIKTTSEYHINIYVDPYLDWTQMGCKIYSGDYILDLAPYYELFKTKD